MTPSAFLELVLSLSVQVAVLIGVCAWLVRQSAQHDTGHRLWGMCHVMILVLTLTALTLPHLRLIPHTLLAGRLPAGTVALSQDWLGRVALVVLASGASLYALAIVAGVIDLRRIIRNARPLTNTSVVDGEPITILVSSRITSPFCWQLQNPVIVLPEQTDEFPPDELNAIVRHELAHLRAGHPVALFLQRIVEMLLWFHPLVWWASHQAELHREFHCDRQSNRNASETASYLRSLLRLCDVTPDRRIGLSVGLSFHGNHSLIRQRVDRLMTSGLAGAVEGSSRKIHRFALIATATLMTCLWLPFNITASSRSAWSPWPEWSAQALHEVGIPARDYEVDGHRLQLHELLEHEAGGESDDD